MSTRRAVLGDPEANASLAEAFGPREGLVEERPACAMAAAERRDPQSGAPSHGGVGGIVESVDAPHWNTVLFGDECRLGAPTLDRMWRSSSRPSHVLGDQDHPKSRSDARLGGDARGRRGAAIGARGAAHAGCPRRAPDGAVNVHRASSPEGSRSTATLANEALVGLDLRAVPSTATSFRMCK